MNYVTSLASELQLYNSSNVEHILRQRYQIDKFDKERIDKLTEMMLDPKSLNVYLVSPLMKS